MNIKEMIEVCEAATPGPWVIKFPGHVFAGEDRLIAGTMGHSDNFTEGLQEENIENAKHIAMMNPAFAIKLLKLWEAVDTEHTVLGSSLEVIAALKELEND